MLDDDPLLPLAEDEAPVLVEDPVLLAVPVLAEDVASPVAVEVLATLTPPCPPAPLGPAAPLLKRSFSERPQAARASALARSGAKRSQGLEAVIVAEIVPKKRAADKRDRDPEHPRRRTTLE